MVSFQKAQTGSRVYNGVGTSPNRGQVSMAGANGYIQRELRNKQRSGVRTPVGNDGASDNRSAVAARSLARQQAPLGSRQQFQNEGRQSNDLEGKRHRYDNKGRPGPKDDGPKGPKGPPQLHINDQGLLELPYNQDFSRGQFEAFADANDQLLALKMEADQQGLEYTQQKMANEGAYKSLQNQTLSSNAARGTAFSSAYGAATTRNASDFANTQGSLESQNTSFNQNLALQRAAIQAALNQQLGLNVQQYGDDLNDQAGGLGYGGRGKRNRRRKKKR